VSTRAVPRPVARLAAIFEGKDSGVWGKLDQLAKSRTRRDRDAEMALCNAVQGPDALVLEVEPTQAADASDAGGAPTLDVRARLVAQRAKVQQRSSKLLSELWALKSAAPLSVLASRTSEFINLESQLHQLQRVDKILNRDINAARRKELGLDRVRQSHRHFDDGPTPRAPGLPPVEEDDDRGDAADDDASADDVDDDADGTDGADDDGEEDDDDRDDESDDDDPDDPDDAAVEEGRGQDAGAAPLAAPRGFAPVPVAQLPRRNGAVGFLTAREAQQRHVLYYDFDVVHLAQVIQFKPAATRADNFVLKGLDEDQYAHRLNVEAYHDPASPAPPTNGAWLYLTRTGS
jgi:hypothetical protein